MALASMLRRSASVAVPLAMRLLGESRQYHASAGLLFSTVNHGAAASRRQICLSFFPSALHFSTESSCVSSSLPHELPLSKVLDYEIDCVVNYQKRDLPLEYFLTRKEEFPYKFKDISGEGVVKFTRQYEGETIEFEINCVKIFDCLLECHEDENDEGKDEGKDVDEDGYYVDEEYEDITPMTFTVKITNGAGTFLELCVSARPVDLLVVGVHVKDAKACKESAYCRLILGKLDDPQTAFLEYLTDRGITASFIAFVHDFMANKHCREYKRWLENVKQFVEA